MPSCSATHRFCARPHPPQVAEGYFRGLIEAGRITEEDLGACLFASKPASGAAILTLSP